MPTLDRIGAGPVTDIVFNAAKGKVNHLAGLPAAADRLVVVVLEAAGLVADDVMADYTSLQALLAGASNEQTTMGRKVAAGASTSVDNTANTQTATFTDPAWTAAAGNAVGALVVCYDASGADTDAQLVPLTKHDWPYTPSGRDVSARVSSGFFVAAGA
jgi:hypothetical protein